MAARARLYRRPVGRSYSRVPAPEGIVRQCGMLGATEPSSGSNVWQALIMEFVLTAGLVSTILGTSSKAQNLGPSQRSGWVHTSSWRDSGPVRSAERR